MELQGKQGIWAVCYILARFFSIPMRVPPDGAGHGQTS